MNQKGLIGVLLPIILVVAGIIVAVYLSQSPQIFKPQAAVTTDNFQDVVATFRLQNPKTEMEKFLNPFGETWASKQSSNSDIPVMLAGAFDRTKSASYGLTERAASFSRLLPSYYPNSYPQAGVNYYLDLEEGYKNLLRNANTNYTFYSQGGGIFTNRPRYSMPSSNIVIRELDKINPNLKHNSYYVINHVEEADLAGYDNMLEDWYVHKKGSDATKPENRLQVGGNGQYIIDVTKPGLQVHMATGVAKAMQDNQLDWLLVDGAGGSIYRPPLAAGDNYPDHFSPQAYFTGTLQTLGAIKAKINPLGKEVIFNPIQPDAIDDNRIAQVRQYLEVTDGAYWENPFRTGNRDYFAPNGPDYYYNQLQKFFDVAQEMNKKLIIESDTVNDIQMQNPNYCTPMFQCEYQKMLDEKGYYEVLKYEQKIQRRHLAMYLLYQTNPQTNLYSHYTLAEPLSYETSEATFADYDLKIGRSVGKIQKVANNIYKRQFEKGLVYVNYSKQPYTIGVDVLTCDDYYQSICQKPHYVTAEGVPVTTFTMPPETGMIFVLPSILTPYNPSFESVWNWKPNQLEWGSVEYTQAKTGRNSFKIGSGISGSPGLVQNFIFKPNTTYTWSSYVKTSNNTVSDVTVALAPTGSTTVTSKFIPNNGGGVYIYDSSIPLGTNDWKQINITFKTSSQGGGGNFYVVMNGGNTGEVWFDDTTLVEGEAAVPPASPIPPPISNMKPHMIADHTSSYCVNTVVRNHIQWASVPGAVIYKIYRATPTSARIKVGETSGIAFNDETVTTGIGYTYTIESVTSENVTVSGDPYTLTAISCTQPSPSASPARKVGDIDNNGRVDIFDFNFLVADYRGTNMRSDLNGDNKVDLFDFNLLITNFGK